MAREVDAILTEREAERPHAAAAQQANIAHHEGKALAPAEYQPVANATGHVRP